MPQALQITDLRVAFEIKKSLKKEPQTARVAIYNLSAKSRGLLTGKGLRVVLEAGYPDSLAQIYAGHSRTIDHPKESVDWVTRIECGTNERQLQFANVLDSFKPGSKIGEAIKKVAGKLVTDVGNAVQQADAIQDTFASGYAMQGNAGVELTRLLAPLDKSWSIQDGRLEILGFAETLQEETVLISPSTGLIGTPELGAPLKKGRPSPMKIKSLLQSKIRCGGRILLNSKNVSGIYKCTSVTHSGDTHGGDWQTEIEAFPVKL